MNFTKYLKQATHFVNILSKLIQVASKLYIHIMSNCSLAVWVQKRQYKGLTTVYYINICHIF